MEGFTQIEAERDAITRRYIRPCKASPGQSLVGFPIELADRCGGTDEVSITQEHVVQRLLEENL